jgi:site-specific DNA recombinase
MRLVGYVRVSTTGQSKNTSLADQRSKIKSYAYAFGHELVEVFEDVVSGKNASDRPQFQLALEALTTTADGIIATKLDRIARNTRDVLELVEDTLKPNHKVLVLLDLNVDTSTPAGMMILTVMAAVASLERSLINERTQSGRKAKFTMGGYAYGSPKFGEHSVEGKLVTHDDEKEIIDIIRRHHKSGKSHRQIAKYLNTNSAKSKRGEKWSGVTVGRIINRLYSK